VNFRYLIGWLKCEGHLQRSLGVYYSKYLM